MRLFYLMAASVAADVVGPPRHVPFVPDSELMHRNEQLKLRDHFIAGDRKCEIVISLNWARAK